MEVTEACHRISTMMFKPGWQLSARPSNRPGHVMVEYVFPTMDSSYPSADRQYRRSVVLAPEMELDVSELDDEPSLFHAVIRGALAIEEHEMCEFARAHPTSAAPLHPHTPEGQRNWARLESRRVVDQILELVS